MTSKSLDYAENVLGVHEVYREVLSFRDSMNDRISELDKALDEKRNFTEKINDREADIISDQRGKHPDMSAASFKDHLKAAVGKDTDSVLYRAQLNQALSTIQGLEFDIDVLKTDIRIRIARLEELGGYFNYLAAVKAEKTTTQKAVNA